MAIIVSKRPILTFWHKLIAVKDDKILAISYLSALSTYSAPYQF